MSWIAAAIPGHDPAVRLTGLCGRASAPADAPLMPTGTLLWDLDWPGTSAPPTVLRVGAGTRGEIGLGLALFSDGTVVIEVDGGTRPISARLAGPGGDSVVLRYSWDAPARRAALSATRPDGSRWTVALLRYPPPLPLANCLETVRAPADGLRLAALSTRWEPTGPVATLAPETRVHTPGGPVALAALRPGAEVWTSRGEVARVRWRDFQWLPAAGSFRPLRVRAPYHGFGRDLVCLGPQPVRVTGSAAEYLFGAEAVLARTGDMLDHQMICPDRGAPVRCFGQILLDRPGLLALADGGAVHPFDAGSALSDPRLQPLTLLTSLPRELVPAHAGSASELPLLRPYEAASLRLTAA